VVWGWDIPRASPVLPDVNHPERCACISLRRSGIQRCSARAAPAPGRPPRTAQAPSGDRGGEV